MTKTAEGRREPNIPVILKMIEDVLPPEGDFCIQSITNDKTVTRHAYGRDPMKIVEFIIRWSIPGRAIFFCISSTQNRSHKKSDAKLCQVINLDIDLKEVTLDADAIILILLGMKYPPTRIHRSGNGIHAYWILEAPARPGDELEAIQKKLARALGGDPSPTHAVAMMRMPGTYNTKNGDWREVTVVHDSGVRYSLAALTEWDVPATILRKAPDQGDIYSQLGEEIGRKTPTDVEEALAQMEYLGTGKGGNVHHTYTVVVGALVTKGKDEEFVVRKLMKALKKLDTKGEQWDMAREEATIRRMYADFKESNERQERQKEALFAELASARREKMIEKRAAATDGDEIEDIATSDFYYYSPRNSYLLAVNGDLWSSPAVDNTLGKGASKWIKKNQTIASLTWAPGEPELVPDRIVNEGGWVSKGKVNTLNLYLPGVIRKGGDASKAGKWTDLVAKVFPDEAEELLDYFAYGIQYPGRKINHGVLLIGTQGIGKDTLFEPVRQAAGPWNCGEIAPNALFEPFNGYVKSVFLRINEAHDLGDIKRFQLYERMKTLLVSPPDVLRCNEKHLREHYVFNCVKVIITSNHSLNSIYLPPEDRRYFVCLSQAMPQDFEENFWTDLWRWYQDGGFAHCNAFLRERDVSKYNPKAPPRKTDAFMQIVASNISSEQEDLSMVLEDLGHPAVVTHEQIWSKADLPLQEWMDDARNRRAFGYRLSDLGYTKMLNPHVKDGRFVVGSKRHVIYGNVEVPQRAKLEAIEAMNREAEWGSEGATVTQLNPSGRGRR